MALQQKPIDADIVTHQEDPLVGLKPLDVEKAEHRNRLPLWPETPAGSIQWYVSLLTQNWLVTGQLVLASVLGQLFALAMPVFYIIIFDRVFGRQNLATLDVIGIGVLAILAFDLIVKMLRAYLAAYQIEWLDKITLTQFMDNIYQALVNNKQKEPLQAESVGYLIKSNQTIATMLIISGLDTGLSLIIVAILLMMHPVLACISLLPLIPIGILSFWNTPKAKHRGQLFHKEQQLCQIKLQELSKHHEALMASNSLGSQSDQVYLKLMKWVESSLSTRVDNISQGNIQGFFTNIGSILTLYIGAHYVLAGEITFGVYLAINMISRIIVGNTQKFLMALIQYQETSEQRESFSGWLGKNVEETTEEFNKKIKLATINGQIECHDVSFSYPEAKIPTLKNISLTIQASQRVVIVGKSGSGKSTLAKTLQNLLIPNKGYITLDNYHLADWDSNTLRQHISICLQQPALLKGSIRENISLNRAYINNQDILNACQWVGFDEEINSSTNGLDTEIHLNGNNVSGGQASKINLARTLAGKPNVLILDEALSQLPPTSKINIFNNIHKNFRQATCIFVSHFIPLHQGVDKIIVLDNGQIVEEGNFKELAQNKGPYYQLYLAGFQQNEKQNDGGQA